MNAPQAPIGQGLIASTEIERLNAVARDSWYTQPIAVTNIRYSIKVFARFWGDRSSCLEMGPAEGVATELLHQRFADLTAVEGSPVFARSLRERFGGITVDESLFEEYRPRKQFDVIVLGHVLEHVADPVQILGLVRGWLAPGGIVCTVVPNARSVHRQAAVIMGLLNDIHDLNATDLHHGHRRVYDPDSFRADFEAAGLRIQTLGGYFLKPLSNAQIQESWTPQMLDAFMALGESYPDIAAETFVIASA